MKFDAWMTEKQYSNTLVAGLLDVTRETIRVWRLGEIVPRKTKIAEIDDLSEGEVKLQDWYDA